jgi:hypothetical protein
MNRKLYGYACLLLIVSTLQITSPAQDTQRFEAFGGYSFTHDSVPLDLNSNFNGWDSSSTVFLNRWLGLTADFSGKYSSQDSPILYLDQQPNGNGKVKNTASSYTYLFGPHFTYRRSRYAPFVESLVGLHNPRQTSTILESAECPPPSSCTGLPAGSSESASYHKFAMAIGGGLDIALSHGVSLRPIEVDYVLLREPVVTIENGNFYYHGVNNNSFRYSTGITFRFGPLLKPPK